MENLRPDEYQDRARAVLDAKQIGASDFGEERGLRFAEVSVTTNISSKTVCRWEVKEPAGDTSSVGDEKHEDADQEHPTQPSYGIGNYAKLRDVLDHRPI